MRRRARFITQIASRGSAEKHDVWCDLAKQDAMEPFFVTLQLSLGLIVWSCLAPGLVICRGSMSLGLQVPLLPKQNGLQGSMGHLYGSQ